MLKKTYKLLLIALLGTFCFSGCGKTSEEEQELAAFSANIADFTNYIKEADQKINGIDVTQKEAPAELLQILDDMDAEFAKFAEIDMPVQYKGVERLADEASENMSLAVSYYHSAYEAESFGKDDAEIAYQHYTRVMDRIKYIGYVVSGDDIPADEHVTIYEETNDSNILEKWLGGDEDESATASETTPEAVE